MEQDDGIELKPLKQVRWQDLEPQDETKPRRFSLCGILLALFALISITVATLWGLSNVFGASSMHYADSGDTLLLKTEAEWLPIAMEMTKTADPSVDCCENPYLCACGGFIANTQLSSGEYYVSKAITTIRDNHNKLLKSVVDEDWPIVAPFYHSCNRTWQHLGFDKILSIYNTLSNCSSKSELFKKMGHIRAHHGLSLAKFSFGISTMTDPYNSSANLLSFTEGENTLPSPIYYKENSEIDLENYQRFIASMFALSPNPISSVDASNILQYESILAEILINTESSVDINTAFSRLTYAQARQILGELIDSYIGEFDVLKEQHLSQVFIVNREYFNQINAFLNDTPLAILRNVVLFSLFKESYPILGPSYYNTFRELSSIVTGTAVHSATASERELHCIRSLTSAMPMLVGHYYVAAAGIDDEFKRYVTELTQITKESLSARLESNTWMDTATKVAAEQKIQQITEQICYPDSWDSVLEFEQLIGSVLNPEDYFDNSRRLKKVNDLLEFDSVLKPVDRGNWFFEFTEKFIESPEVINAFYAPNMNRITISAGITRPPFIYNFHDAIPLLVSTFGGLVAVIGHELNHGLDNQGSQFNGKGELQDWWTDVSRRQFALEAECIASSRSRQQTQIPGIYVDGIRVLGESIADLGGIETALDAMYAWEELHFTPDELKIYNNALQSVFPNLSKEQLFFMFFMQNYCEVQTDQYVYELVESDPHPPGQQRVNGLLADVPRFAEAFHCKSGTTYNEPDSCSIL